MDAANNHDLKFKLFEAARNGDCAKFTTLASQITPPQTSLSFSTSHRKDTLLHVAVVYGHHELTQYIVTKIPEFVTSKNFTGDTPLHVAARAGNLLVVESLFHNADLQAVNEDGNMPDIQAVSEDGNTPDLQAVNEDRNAPEILAVNEDGNTPLHEAVIHNRIMVAEFLLSRIQDLKDVLKVNRKGKSPLYIAVESRNARILRNILSLFAIGTIQNGTNEGVSENQNALRDAIMENIMAGTSQTGTNEHVDASGHVLSEAIPENTTAGTSQTGRTDEHADANGHVLSEAIPENTTVSTSHNGTNEHVNANKSVLSDAMPESLMGTSQNGTNEHVNANKFVPSEAIVLENTTAGTSQIGTNEHVNANKSVQSDAISENIIGSSNIASKTQVDEDVETKKCVLHVAITGKDLGILRMVAENVVHQLHDSDNHLLHLAASIGFLDGVRYLLDRKFSMDVLRHDEDGFCPIHHASKNGHLQVTKALLDHYPDAREFLSKRHQNILHVAAENGKDNIVKYILKTKWAEFLINEKDKDGYTPLHLATKNWHPKVVSALTWDPRVDLKQVNEKGLTALEVAETCMKIMAPFKNRLTWIALRSAGTPRTRIIDPYSVKSLEATKYEPYNMNYCKARVNTLLLVSALVATVTFAAGFTMPGGNNSSGTSHVGMVSMLHRTRFKIFVICDSIAVYSSIIVMVMLMWAQLGDLNLMLNALRLAQRLLGLSLAMMSLAFYAGVDLVVTEFRVLSIGVLVMGIIAFIILLAFFVPLVLPYTSKLIIFRYISYYPFKGLMLIS